MGGLFWELAGGVIQDGSCCFPKPRKLCKQVEELRALFKALDTEPVAAIIRLLHGLAPFYAVLKMHFFAFSSCASYAQGHNVHDDDDDDDDEDV